MAQTPAWPVRAGAARGEAPADIGCDWQRVDPRFARCLTCPLPRCRYDYPWREQQAAARLIAGILGQDEHPRRPRAHRAPPRNPPPREAAGPVAVALADGTLARIAHQALGRGRSRREVGSAPRGGSL